MVSLPYERAQQLVDEALVTPMRGATLGNFVYVRDSDNDADSDEDPDDDLDI